MSLPSIEILLIAERLCGSRQQALDWYYHESLPTFDGQTPQQLVTSGRDGDLLHYLQSLQAGAG